MEANGVGPGQECFEIDQLDTYYFKGEPKPMGYTYEGRAIRR